MRGQVASVFVVPVELDPIGQLSVYRIVYTVAKGSGSVNGRNAGGPGAASAFLAVPTDDEFPRVKDREAEAKQNLSRCA